MKDKTLRVIYYLCIGIYVLSTMVAFYVNRDDLFMTIVACFTPFMFPLFLKLIHIKAPYEILICNIMFVYFASLIGSCFGGYSMPYFDKVVHGISGVFACELAYMVYKYYLPFDHRKSLMFIFLNVSHMAIALLWEFYEYAVLILMNNDAIRHYSTGVHDSMTDMIVASIGGLCLCVYLLAFDQSSKPHFFVSLQQKLVYLNRE